MAKLLKDILKQAHDTIKGIRPSTTEPASTGKDPGVDYKPKAGDEDDFIAKHSVQKWDDIAGNPNFADKVKYSLEKEKHHGNTQTKAKAANEEVINELSTATKSDYRVKAGDEAKRLRTRIGIMNKVKSDDDVVKSAADNVKKDMKRKLNNRVDGILRSTRSEETDPGFSKLKEDWTVTHADGSVTKHEGARDALKASRNSPGSKVGATHGAMGQKAADVLGTHQKANLGTFSASGYTPPEKKKKIKEEVEQVNELSSKILGSYINKSAASLGKAGYKAGSTDGTAAKLDPHINIINKRSAGIKRAVGKLTKEDTQIDELSTDLLHRAAHKAAKMAMTDVQGRSGPIFKKRAAQANKFRDKGMSQEKKEKAVKEEALDEISTKLALNYAKGASKSMDTAAAQGSAGYETFMKRSAGHKLALDKTNPEHKRLKAKVGTSDANAKDAAYKKAVSEETIDEVVVNRQMTPKEKAARAEYLKKHSEKLAGHDTGVTPKKSFKDVNTERGDYTHQPSKMGLRHAMGAGYYKAEEVEHVAEVLTKSTSAGETIHDFVHSDNPKFKGKSKEKRKEMALGAYYAKQNEAYAVEPLLGGDQPPRGHSDEAAEMVKTELKALANKAMHLAMQMPDSMHVEPWCQSKIAVAKEMVSAVHDYMIYGEHNKPEEDEQSDVPMTFPNMNSGNAGQNV